MHNACLLNYSSLDKVLRHATTTIWRYFTSLRTSGINPAAETLLWGSIGIELVLTRYSFTLQVQHQDQQSELLPHGRPLSNAKLKPNHTLKMRPLPGEPADTSDRRALGPTLPNLHDHLAATGGSSLHFVRLFLSWIHQAKPIQDQDSTPALRGKRNPWVIMRQPAPVSEGGTTTFKKKKKKE